MPCLQLPLCGLAPLARDRRTVQRLLTRHSASSDLEERADWLVALTAHSDTALCNSRHYSLSLSIPLLGKKSKYH